MTCSTCHRDANDNAVAYYDVGVLTPRLEVLAVPHRAGTNHPDRPLFVFAVDDEKNKTKNTHE